jgi:hypothetical protein
MGEVAPLWELILHWSSKTSCATVPLEAQAIHFFAHKTVRA